MKYSIYDIIKRFYSYYLSQPITEDVALDLIEDLNFICDTSHKGFHIFDGIIEIIPTIPEIQPQDQPEIQPQDQPEIQPQDQPEIQPQDQPGIQPQDQLILLSVLRAREIKGDQKSTDWLMNRHNYITASVTASCAGLMGDVARENQILEKASYGQYKTFFGNKYTDIGNIYEPVTDMVYEKKSGNKINHFGLIASTKIPYLAASTDGITDNLRNIEIKTLASRTLDGHIKKEYYNQMQHQMYCLDLDVSDFLEAKYKVCQKNMYPLMSHNKGIIIEYYTYKDGHAYLYSELGADLSWIDSAEAEIACNDKLIHVRTFCYILHDYLCQEVRRDPNWIKVMSPKFESFWNNVQRLRADASALSKRIAKRGKSLTPNFGNSMF